MRLQRHFKLAEQRYVREGGYEIERFTDVSDDELDTVLRELQRQYPNCGQQLLQGFLRQRGIIVPCRRLRESIVRRNPINRHVCCRDDYKFSKMIGQKPLIVILSLNLIGHPYIALEK